LLLIAAAACAEIFCDIMPSNPIGSVEILRDLEATLSEPMFRGMPIGSMLGHAAIIELLNGYGDWSLAARWKNRARRIKYFLRSGRNRDVAPTIPENRVLVTWIYDNYRQNDLIRPVVEAIGPERCVVLGGEPEVAPLVPGGAAAVCWVDVTQFDAAAWRSDYLKCRPEWHRRLKTWCNKYDLPRGVFDSFAFHMMVASRSVAGCLEFLGRSRPTVVLTEYDRNDHWATLILVARSLGIPTLTMVHGVMGEKAVGFTPVLADKILCWGEMQRRQLIDGGERRAEIVVAGCPRITRELPLSPAEARAKLGLPAEKPVVLLGTTPVSHRECIETAECFCAAMNGVESVSAIVRLHPSERLADYESVAKRYPNVHFGGNADATLDDALAAADIVVVTSSGFGGDALVKRRLAIVLALPNIVLGYGQDLIDQAGCPAATSPESLRKTVQQLLSAGPERRRCEQSREAFVQDFVAYFGEESAKRIAEQVLTARNTEYFRECL
jgi:hypothetical protein